RAAAETRARCTAGFDPAVVEPGVIVDRPRGTTSQQEHEKGCPWPRLSHHRLLIGPLIAKFRLRTGDLLAPDAAGRDDDVVVPHLPRRPVVGVEPEFERTEARPRIGVAGRVIAGVDEERAID